MQLSLALNFLGPDMIHMQNVNHFALEILFVVRSDQACTHMSIKGVIIAFKTNSFNHFHAQLHVDAWSS